jgi:hypothetical protein
MDKLKSKKRIVGSLRGIVRTEFVMSWRIVIPALYKN